MTLPRSAADVLAGHVLFELEAIDRMYLNLYQPRLQHGAGVAAFFVGHREHRFASAMTGGWCRPRCCMWGWRRKSSGCSGPASAATRSPGHLPVAGAGLGSGEPVLLLLRR